MGARIIAILLFTYLLVSMPGAAPATKADLNLLLNSALTDAQCRVSFETGLMDAMISLFPPMSSLLNPQIEVMNSDSSQLKQYASKGDAMNYSIYVQETFTKHLKQNADMIQAGLENLKSSATGGGTGGAGDGTGGGGTGGGTGGAGDGTGGGGNGTGASMDELKASMESLQSAYKSLRGAEGTCFDVKGHVKLVLDYYNATLDGYESRAQNLTGRGINASNLLSLVGSARLQIVAPLKNGVNSASNSSQLRMMLYQYCLYDGCVNGTNFHMAAKFEAMRMADLLAAMAPKAVEEGLGGNVTALKASLDETNAEIGAWGANDASPTQLMAAWAGIRSAAKGSHSIYIALNDGAGTD